MNHDLISNGRNEISGLLLYLTVILRHSKKGFIELNYLETYNNIKKFVKIQADKGLNLKCLAKKEFKTVSINLHHNECYFSCFLMILYPFYYSALELCNKMTQIIFRKFFLHCPEFNGLFYGLLDFVKRLFHMVLFYK